MNREDFDKIIDIKDWEFEFQQRETHPVIMSDLWIRAIRDFMPDALRLRVKSPDYLFTDSYKGYIKSADKENILQNLRTAVSDPEYFRYIIDRTLNVIEEFDSLATLIVSSLAPDVSRKEIADKWDAVEMKYLEMVPWFYIPWYLTEENIISDQVKRGLLQYKDKVEKVVDFNTALGILLFPTKETRTQREQRAFYGLVLLASRNGGFENDDEFNRQVSTYLENFSWFRTYFLLPLDLLSREELLVRVKGALRSSFVHEYEMQEKKKLEFGAMAETLCAIVANDKILLKAIDDARELGWLLTASVENGIFATSKLIPFYKLISRTVGVSYDRWVYFTSNEIRSLLRDGEKVSETEIEERVLACAVLMVKGKVAWMYGKEAKEFSGFVESGENAITTNVKEFSGQPAYRGKVTGKAKIALNSRDAHDLVSGEVLVTSMTSPDYVPAMRRALAIVTNEGGLLSHAAIMSREFGKPCIVGTKIATKVLKDGDMVEVDAERGIVTIIKKNQ